MTLEDLERARLVLAGGHHGSKNLFARMLGLSGAQSLARINRDGAIPERIQNRIRFLSRLSAPELASIREHAGTIGRGQRGKRGITGVQAAAAAGVTAGTRSGRRQCVEQ